MLDCREWEIWQKYNLIVGIDEAGRGPWAGPLLASAVVFPKNFEGVNKYLLENINDSKKLQNIKRKELFDLIIENVLAYSIIKIDNVEIDKIGIGNANRKIVNLLLKDLEKKVSFDFVATDYIAKLKIDNYDFETFKKGDQRLVSIAAASILAKVTRDELMENFYDKQYPEYAFAQHKGYGTKLHLEMLKKYGLSPIHRLSFSPMKNMLK